MLVGAFNRDKVLVRGKGLLHDCETSAPTPRPAIKVAPLVRPGESWRLTAEWQKYHTTGDMSRFSQLYGNKV